MVDRRAAASVRLGSHISCRIPDHWVLVAWNVGGSNQEIARALVTVGRVTATIDQSQLIRPTLGVGTAWCRLTPIV